MLVGGAATSGAIYGGKGNDVLSVAGNVIGGNVEGNSGADTITVAGTASAALVAGGKGNDTISLAAVDGGQVGGQLGADTMVVGGVLKNALVSMTNVGDPENSADLADSLTVGGSVSNSTVYAGAGADFMSVAGAMIAGEVVRRQRQRQRDSGRQPWRCGHVGLRVRTPWLLLRQMLQPFWVEPRTTRSASPVQCVIPAWWVDSVWTASPRLVSCVVRRFGAVTRRMVLAPLMVLTTSVLLPLLPRLCTATAALTACLSVVVRQLRRFMAVQITIW